MCLPPARERCEERRGEEEGEESFRGGKLLTSLVPSVEYLGVMILYQNICSHYYRGESKAIPWSFS